MIDLRSFPFGVVPKESGWGSNFLCQHRHHNFRIKDKLFFTEDSLCKEVNQNVHLKCRSIPDGPTNIFAVPFTDCSSSKVQSNHLIPLKKQKTRH